MSLGGFNSTMHAISFLFFKHPRVCCRGSPSTSFLVSDSWRTFEAVEFWTLAAISSPLRDCYSWMWDSSQSLCRLLWEIPQTLLLSLMQRALAMWKQPSCILTGFSAVYGSKVNRSYSLKPLSKVNLLRVFFFITMIQKINCHIKRNLETHLTCRSWIV